MDHEALSRLGLEPKDIEHMSPRQRDRLLAEVNTGRAATEHHSKVLDHNRKVAEKVGRQDFEGGVSVEALTAARIAEQNEAARRAQAQQQVNSAANVAKEVRDHNETVHGRKNVPEHIAELLQEPAIDLAKQRVEQAEETGLGPNQATHGHPANSQEQAEATIANTQKEMADRATSEKYHADQTYQGHSGPVKSSRTPVFDNEGTFKGAMVDGVFEPDPDYVEGQQTGDETGANNGASSVPGGGSNEQGNGQPAGNSPPTPGDVTLAGLGDEGEAPNRRGRRASQRPAPSRAVGDGPKSE